MRHAGYRVKVRYPHNASAFYLQDHTGYFTPEWHLSKTHDRERLTVECELAAIWPRKSRAMAVAACLQAEFERGGLEARVTITSVSLTDNHPSWERVIR